MNRVLHALKNNRCVIAVNSELLARPDINASLKASNAPTVALGEPIEPAKAIDDVEKLIEQARATLGDGPVYLSFDIDSLDPGFAPGTGTPEIGGLTPIQALEIIRGCRGLNLVGADLVEVSPPYDPRGNTALLAANLLYEMLCVLPGVSYRDK